jgi:hypothetical protein
LKELSWSGYNVDPSTAEELGSIPDMGLAETKEAIASASKAFKTWSKKTAKVRRRCECIFQYVEFALCVGAPRLANEVLCSYARA